jgi:hypothetical protein
VFFRLFTLLEDQCHKLDLEMAASSSSQEGDRPGFVAFTEVIKKERALLDEKATLDSELKWLGQILSHLVINSANPNTDPQVVGVNKLTAERKKKFNAIVSISQNGVTVYLRLLFDKGEGTGSSNHHRQERPIKERWTICEKPRQNLGGFQCPSPGLLWWNICGQPCSQDTQSNDLQ